MKAEKGFTLIEVMVILAIVAIIAVAVYNAYFSSVKAWKYNKSRLEVQRVQDLTDRWISKYARQATSVKTDYTNTDLTNDQNILYLEYNDSGTTKEVAFGRGSDKDDYLYFYDITNNSQRKISDLKFTDPVFSYNNGLIKIKAGIINQEDNTIYQFNSYFNQRLIE